MTPPLLTPVLCTVIGLGLMTNPATASPLQAGRPDPGPWAGPNLLLVLNQDQFAGHWKQFKGDLKQKWGAFTDDDLLYIEGSYDKYEGKLQERYGDRREEIKQWTDKWFKDHDFEKDVKQAP